MNWFATSVLIIGLLIWYSRKASPARTGAKAKVPAEQLKDILKSGDPEKMASALERFSGPLDRHRLLTALVQGVYPQRADGTAREHLYAYGTSYLGEFDRIAPALQAESAPEAPDVPVFRCLAIAMEEDERFDEALNICRLALDWDLDDGTKTGYAGRMRRLEKKKAAE